MFLIFAIEMQRIEYSTIQYNIFICHNKKVHHVNISRIHMPRIIIFVHFPAFEKKRKHLRIIITERPKQSWSRRGKMNEQIWEEFWSTCEHSASLLRYTSYLNFTLFYRNSQTFWKLQRNDISVSFPIV